MDKELSLDEMASQKVDPDSKHNFSVDNGDIIIMPADINDDEVGEDGIPISTLTHQRGVLKGIEKAIEKYKDDSEKQRLVFIEIIEKSVKFGIFGENEIEPILKEKGIKTP